MKGEISKFDSTPGKTRRGFCARCGSTLTCEGLPGPTETHDRLRHVKLSAHGLSRCIRESHEQLLAALAEEQATIPSTYRFKN